VTRLNEEQLFGTNDVLCALTQFILDRIIYVLMSKNVNLCIFMFSFLLSFFINKIQLANLKI